MPTLTVKVEIIDARDGCTYERVYVDTPDWSESTRDLVTLVLGDDVYLDYATCNIGNGSASGVLKPLPRDPYSQTIGTWLVTDYAGDK